MIRYIQGNLLQADAEAVVNAVNTVGVMGKGIALAFKEAYPENFAEYEAACRAHLLKTGHMFVTENRSLQGPRWIINFPTKKHWRQPSRFEWITEGLVDLRRVRVRLATYPEETAAAWLVKAQARREELDSSVGPIEEDLKRWLPSSWPLTGLAVQSMVQSAITSLDEGLRAMRQIEAQSRAEPAGPSP